MTKLSRNKNEQHSIRDIILGAKNSISMDSVLYGLALQREKARSVQNSNVDANSVATPPPNEIAYLRLLYLIAGWLFRAETFGVDLGVDPVIKSALDGPDGDLLCKYYPLRLGLEPIDNFKFCGPEDENLPNQIPVALRHLKQLTSFIEKLESDNPGKLKVLVADDSQVFRSSFSRILRSKGYKVTQAKSGNDALKMLDRSQFDVAFIDVQMPGMRGDTVCKKIREEKNLLDLPVFLITAHEDLERQVHKRFAGQDMIINKNKLEEELLESLKYFGLETSAQLQQPLLKTD